jgi:hypothetical protein
MVWVLKTQTYYILLIQPNLLGYFSIRKAITTLVFKANIKVGNGGLPIIGAFYTSRRGVADILAGVHLASLLFPLWHTVCFLLCVRVLSGASEAKPRADVEQNNE